MSQKVLGEHVGLKFQTVSKYENQENAPEDFLRKCAEVLGASYEEISQSRGEELREIHPDPSADSLPLAALTGEQLESLFRAMSVEVSTVAPERRKLLYTAISRISEELNKRTP